MDNEQKQNPEIQKGFNAGYLLEKLNPELSQKLRAGMTDKNNPFFLGLTKGAEQYNQESFFDSPPPNIPDSITDLNMDNPDVDFGKDLNMDNDGIEL